MRCLLEVVAIKTILCWQGGVIAQADAVKPAAPAGALSPNEFKVRSYGSLR